MEYFRLNLKTIVKNDNYFLRCSSFTTNWCCSFQVMLKIQNLWWVVAMMVVLVVMVQLQVQQWISISYTVLHLRYWLSVYTVNVLVDRYTAWRKKCYFCVENCCVASEVFWVRNKCINIIRQLAFRKRYIFFINL